ncbi:hypothetical protein GCM10008986_33020 [Salinibacillus aidingensis]|uniref:Uncharacterized protein n=1 Tax=Salinibacillus aidingensis TaxID=237684 RepID=A0ABP3LKL1_9BACI
MTAIETGAADKMFLIMYTQINDETFSSYMAGVKRWKMNL